jgi:hypothetical protein
MIVLLLAIIGIQIRLQVILHKIFPLIAELAIKNPNGPYKSITVDSDGNVELDSHSSELLDALLTLCAVGKATSLTETMYQMRLCGLQITVPDLKKLIAFLKKEGHITAIYDDLFPAKN